MQKVEPLRQLGLPHTLQAPLQNIQTAVPRMMDLGMDDQPTTALTPEAPISTWCAQGCGVCVWVRGCW